MQHSKLHVLPEMSLFWNLVASFVRRLRRSSLSADAACERGPLLRRRVRDVSETCPETCPKTCPRRVRDMSETCPRRVRDVSPTCPRRVRDVSARRVPDVSHFQFPRLLQNITDVIKLLITNVTRCNAGYKAIIHVNI